jgi:cytochrome c
MGNDPLFINKFAAAVLSAGLLAMITGFIAHQFFHPHIPETPAYAIAEGVVAASTQTAEAPAGPEPVAPMLASASVESGEKVAKKCASCHTFEKGGKNKIGPNLWNVVGADKAHIEDFSYSGAMQAAEGNWDYETLSEFLYSPRDVVSGTKMTFAGLKKAQDRADIIVYLRSLSDNPQPLP